MREVQDHFFRSAKREGYRSRAAYKLIEIDEKRRLLRPGACVLDCGCAPGSWLQVAARRVGGHGRVVGIDLEAVGNGSLGDNVRTMRGDLGTVDSEALLGAIRDLGRDRYDVILSDMAPRTSGDRTIDHHASARLCRTVLDLCPALLRPGGAVVMKVFEGEAYPDLLRDAGNLFEAVKGFKPKASRAISREMYVIATGYRAKPPTQKDTPPPKPRPTGWG